MVDSSWQTVALPDRGQQLRLYLAALRDAQEQSSRGRPRVAAQTVFNRWHSWRGRAIEALVREALWLAATADALPWPDVSAVGGWWNRRFDPEIDLMGANRARARPTTTGLSSSGS